MAKKTKRTKTNPQITPSVGLKEYLISSGTVDVMIKNYKKNQLLTLHEENGYDPNAERPADKQKRKKNLTTPQGFHETLSVWFPIDILEEYLKYIKNRYRQVADQNLEYGKISGVRVTLAAYGGKKDKFSDGNPRLTAILVPTIEQEKLHESFTDEDIENYPHVKHVPMYLKRNIKRRSEKEILEFHHYKPGDENENTGLRGKPFPPPPQGG